MHETVLRVGVLLTAGGVLAWQANALRELRRRVSGAELVALVRLPAPRTSAVFEAYRRFDRWLFLRNHADAFAPVDLSRDDGGGAKAPAEIDLTSAAPRHAVAALAPLALDVVLDLGDHRAPDELARAARYGLWSFQHGRGGVAAPGFAEMIEGQLVTEGLVRVVRGGLERVARCTASATHQYSIFLTGNHAYWKAGSLIASALTDLCRDGWDEATRPWHEAATAPTPAMPEAVAPAAPPATSVSPLRLARQAVRLLGRYVGDGVERNLFEHRWELAHRPLASETLGTPWEPQAIRNGGYAQADPFPFDVDGRTHVFFERVPVRHGKGTIAHAEVSMSGALGPATVVLDAPHHVSYPQVFRWRDRFYMTVESRQARRIDLYRATEFPLRWTFESTVLDDYPAADPTLVEHDGRLWLFAATSASGGPAVDELSVHYADDLRGPWTPHPRNPIVSDVCRARPAGRVFRDARGLIRPAQDCSVRYGYRVIFNRITTLTTTDYADEPCGALGPEVVPGSLACHTFNRNAHGEWSDFIRRSPRLRWLGRAGR